MSRLLLLAAIFIALGLNPTVYGFEKPGHADLPDLDKRVAGGPVPAGKVAAAERLKQRLPQLHVDFDPILKTPKSVVARDGLLSGPRGRGKSIAAEITDATTADTPLNPLNAFLKEHKEVFGHGEEKLQEARVKRQHVAKNGLRSYAWQQEFDGLEVAGAVLTSHITRDGELVSVSSQFLGDLEAAANAGTPKRRALQFTPAITAAEAIQFAAESVGENLARQEIVGPGEEPQGKEKRQTFKAGNLPGEAEVKLVWLPLSDSALKLCWEVEITRHAGGERFRLHVDAETGEVLVRHRLTRYLADASYRVFTSDSPSPFSPGHATPLTNQPPLVDRALLTFSALSTNASPTGWIHPADNETRGNNVDAHLDRNADDLPDLPRPQGNPFRVFDFPIDFTRPPSTYGEAAVVQLFYWCNWMHDTLYELGFTETAGNFQKDNFGRGGIGNDLVLADAQDGSGTDNANFTPTADGKPPRIQMYTFTGPTPDRDGDFDAEIIIHEYTHGLSDRLVGGGAGISALQTGGMGEGWSDFYALALLSESSDDPHAAYPMGGYATDNFFGLKHNYYFGIRRYPYSTDLSKNPLTFKDIDPTQAIPHSDVPLNPIDTFNPAFAAEVHNQGEVWCVTLWEMRANLVDKYGFAGNRLALQLITDGMKLSPPNPNFLQARDAIILADQVDNGGANFAEIWRAFAKRGMGFSATSPDASTTIGLVEAYDLPDALLIVPAAGFISAGALGHPASPNCKTYVITNHSEASITWSATTAQNWISVTPNRGALAPKSGLSVTVCLNAAANQLGLGSYAGTVTFSNETTHVAQEREVSLSVMAFSSLPFFDDFERGSLQPPWQVTGSGAFRVQVTDQNGPRAGRHLTFDNTGNGINSRNEVTLGLDLAGYSNVVLRFWAKDFGDESDGPPPTPFVGGADFDGVAISANGIEWYEVQPLRELRAVYTELSVDLDEAIARFGLSYNENFRLRFNQFDNFSIPLDGIAIDDVSVTGVPVARLAVSLPSEAQEGDGLVEGRVSIGVPREHDLEIQLISSDTSKLRVPTRIVLPAGSTQAVFNITIADNQLADGTQNAMVTASAMEFSARSATIAIHDNERNRLRIKLSRTRAREGDGLLRKKGVVKLDRKAKRDLQIQLSSSDREEVRVPAAVTLKAGHHKAKFDVFIFDDTKLDGTRRATITAHVENWRDGAAEVEVADNDIARLQVSLPLRASEGNGLLANAGQVRVMATLQTNLTIALASSDNTELTVPQFVTLPAGKFTVDFDVAIGDDAEADGLQTVSVTATAPHHPSAAATMDVLDDETPPEPYQPQPTHRAGSVAITADLAWLGGVGEIVRNGGFETGDFTGWGFETTGFGGFVLNDGTLNPESFDGPSPPFEGKFSVVTDQIGGGHHVMYQELFIPAGVRSATLSWVDKIRNHSIQYDFNQFFQVEVRDNASQVLEVLFNTPPGFPLTNDWTARSFDLSAYRGRTIRIAFVEEDHQGYFNVHLDNISVQLADNGVTTFDVYFGTNATLSSQNFLGNTVTNFWELPDLALNTTYYWQIISRRGPAFTAGPIWEFTTRAIGSVNHFEFGPIDSNQIVGQPFAATITARDDINNVATAFADAVQLRAFRGLSNSSAVVVTEIDPGTNDRIEFINVSGRRLDISSWQVITYDTRSWPAPRSIVTIPTNTMTPPGGIFVVSAFGVTPGRYPAFFTGTNIVWNNGVVSNHIAVLMRDASGQPVDFVCAADAQAGQISAPFSISQDEWSGPPIAANTNTVLTYQRVGNVDNGAAGDWVLATNSIGRKHANLQVPFAPRYPVSITPTVASNFVQGVWSGELTFNGPAEPITVVADDGQRHLGVAGPFAAAAASDLALAVLDSPDVVIFGDELSYRFIVSNTGPNDASAVVLSNALPADVDFVSVSSSQGACGRVATPLGTALLCDLGALAANTSATVTLTVRPTRVGVITNTAMITRSGSDGFEANNSATAESTVIYPVVSTGALLLNEGHSTTNMVFTLRLSAPSQLQVSVDFRTVEISATAGVDYIATNGILTFPPGATNRTLTVPIIGDRLDEALEQFGLELSAPVNCAIATPAVRGRILDDDPTPALTISDAIVMEPAPGSSTDVSFTVRLSAPSGLTVFVNYTTTNGSALSGLDYFTDFGRLEFPPGITNQTFSVRVIGDTTFESNEVFHVRLFSPVNGALGDPLGSVTVLDNGFVDLDHFKWDPISSPQAAGVPFAATITARDGRDDLFPGFNGNVRISGIAASRVMSVGAGTNAWELPMGTLYHDARAQIIYLADEIGAPGKINALALNVIHAPGQTMSNWTIRLKHTRLANYPRAAWENDAWTVVYRHDQVIHGAGWTIFFFDRPFDYDGTNHLMVDLSFDNSTYTFDGVCASFIAEANRSIYFQTDGAFGDPLDWAGTNGPPPSVSRQVPQVRFTIENFADVAPTEAGPFVNGTWTGQIAVLAPGTNIVLRALHESGRNGSSAPFRVDGNALTIRAITAPGGAIRLSFATTPGASYRLEATESLANPEWKTVADNVAGTGSVIEVIDAQAALQPQRFYRVRMLP